MSLIKDGPLAHFDCGKDCDMPTSPFRVKEFHEYLTFRGDHGGKGKPVTVETQVNDWFEEIAKDEENEYDVRQVLATKLHASTDSILVFYEVTPVVSVED